MTFASPLRPKRGDREPFRGASPSARSLALVRSSAGWISVAAAVLATSARVGASVDVAASVDTPAVYLGDIVTYRLLITYDDGDTVMAVPHGVNLYAFQVRDYRPIKRHRTTTGQWREGDLYEITAYRPGTYAIPPIPIEYRTASGKTGELVTQPLTVEIRSLGVTESDTLRDIKPPVDLPAKVRRWVWVALACTGAAVAGVVAFAVWRKHRQGAGEPAPLEPEVVDELAELDRIPAADLVAQGAIRELYFLVSEAMRRYVGRRYRIAAMELTHEELADELEAANVSAADATLLLMFLGECDLVKFARFIPPYDEVNGLLERARQIVRETQFRPALGHSPGTARPPGVAQRTAIPVEAAVGVRDESDASPGGGA